MDSAVGYVEVKRDQVKCIVRAKVVPEHRVSNKQYMVTVTLNEKDEVILQATCDGCAASAGGCKHTLVFLFWLEKRSSEPSSTSVQCYWKKPALSGIRSDPIKCEDIFPKSKKIKLSPKDPSVLTKFIQECRKQRVSNSLATCFTNEKPSFNIFDLTVEYLKNENEDFDKYMSFLNNKVTPSVINEIKLKTKSQINSKLWHNIRQGRITASKIYEASRCKTDGTLVQQILGGYKVPETKFIKRGKILEQSVIEEAEKMLNFKVEKSGFILINGVVGASPDGVGEDFIIECKCPSSEKTLKTYFDNGIIQNRYVAQMQTQMHAAKKQKAVFCVADPKFEENKKITLCWLNYDAQYTRDLIDKALMFWRMFIYKKIIISAKT